MFFVRAPHSKIWSLCGSHSEEYQLGVKISSHLQRDFVRNNLRILRSLMILKILTILRNLMILSNLRVLRFLRILKILKDTLSLKHQMHA